MRILHLVHQYPPEHIGGTELYTRSLAQQLAQRGHQVAVFHRRNVAGTGLAVWDDVGVHVWSAWAGQVGVVSRFLATFGPSTLTAAFGRVLDVVMPDVVHVQHMMGLPIAILALVQRRRIPMLITLHDYWWMCANAQLLTNYSLELCGGPRAYLNCARCALARANHHKLVLAWPAAASVCAWRNALLRNILRSARRLVAPTQFVARWYAEHRVPEEKLIVVPHGIERAGDDLPSRSRTDGNVRFVYIGGIAPQKGVHILVEAFRDLKGPAELLIAGDLSADALYGRDLQSRATVKVRFLGKLARPQVWAALAQADALMVPSLWYETFSLIAHEAFAAGVPVIASRLGALADAVHDGEDGILVTPGDVHAWRTTLQRLVDEPSLLVSLRANVRSPLSLAEHVDRIENLYHQIVQDGWELDFLAETMAVTHKDDVADE